jgi:hypothetical protein
MTSNQNLPQEKFEELSQCSSGTESMECVDEAYIGFFFDTFDLDDDMVYINDSLFSSTIPDSTEISQNNGEHQQLLNSRSSQKCMLHFANIEPAAELTHVFDEELLSQASGQESRQQEHNQLCRLSESMRRSDITRKLIICQRKAMFLTQYDPQLTAFCMSASSYTLAANAALFCDSTATSYRGKAA